MKSVHIINTQIVLQPQFVIVSARQRPRNISHDPIDPESQLCEKAKVRNRSKRCGSILSCDATEPQIKLLSALNFVLSVISGNALIGSLIVLYAMIGIIGLVTTLLALYYNGPLRPPRPS